MNRIFLDFIESQWFISHIEKKCREYDETTKMEKENFLKGQHLRTVFKDANVDPKFRHQMIGKCGLIRANTHSEN